MRAALPRWERPASAAATEDLLGSRAKADVRELACREAAFVANFCAEGHSDGAARVRHFAGGPLCRICIATMPQHNLELVRRYATFVAHKCPAVGCSEVAARMCSPSIRSYYIGKMLLMAPRGFTDPWRTLESVVILMRVKEPAQ